MLARVGACAAVGAVLVVLVCPAEAGYDWPLVPWGAYHQRHPNCQAGNPHFPYAQPAPTYGPLGQIPAQPSPYRYPWYGEAWGVPTYNWGYFGAHSHPTTRWHCGYYGDVTHWATWRRY